MRRHPLPLAPGPHDALGSGPRRRPGLVVRRRPEPGTPAYVARDAQNIKDAYGRIIGPGGQLQNPAYLAALTLAGTADQTQQLMEQAASPTRLAVTPGRVVPGWNVGNPLRTGWNGTRGLSQRISFTNRYGALLNGTVYRPKPGRARPVHRPGPPRAVPGRRDHRPAPCRAARGCTAGSPRTSPSAATWCSPTTCRARAAARPSRTSRCPAARATRCRSATRSPHRRTASSSAAPARRPSSCPTSWSAPRTPCRSSPRPRRTTTPTRAPRARR